MTLENLEKEKFESIPAGNLEHADEVVPLNVEGNTESQQKLEFPVEERLAGRENYAVLESFRKSGREKLEVLHDSEMTESIAEYIVGLEELKFENWTKLSLEQRRDLLNRVERKIATIEHRPPLPINVEQMRPQTFGYQSAFFHKIALNSLYVGSNKKSDYLEVLDTIIHEGRHAYQHYNVDKKLIHESASVVATWRENFYDPKYRYYSGDSVVIPVKGRMTDVGYRLYYYQPVEIDARNFAQDVMIKLRKMGFIK